MRKDPRTGLTLTELIVAFGISLLALTVILKVFFLVRHHYARIAVRQALQQEIRRVAETVSQDLKAAAVGSVKILPAERAAADAPMTIEFRRPAPGEKAGQGDQPATARVRYGFTPPLLKRTIATGKEGAMVGGRILTPALLQFEMLPTRAAEGQPGEGQPAVPPPVPAGEKPETTFTLRFLGSRPVPGSRLMEFHEEITLVTLRSAGTGETGFLSREELADKGEAALSEADPTGDALLKVDDDLTLETAMKMDPEQLQQLKQAQQDNLGQIQDCLNKTNGQISDAVPTRWPWTAAADGIKSATGLGTVSDLGKAREIANGLMAEEDPERLSQRITELKKNQEAKEKEFLTRAFSKTDPAEMEGKLKGLSPETREKLQLLALRSKMMDRERNLAQQRENVSSGGQAKKAEGVIDQFLKPSVFLKEKNESEQDFQARQKADQDQKAALQYLYQRAHLSAVMQEGDDTWASSVTDPPSEYQSFEMIQKILSFAAIKATVTKGKKAAQKNLAIIDEALAAKS